MATDFARLDAMTDDDIDCSDIPAMTYEELRDAEWIIGLPGSRNISFSINKKTYEYFENTGKGYLNRLNILVNSLLENYVKQQQAQEVI